MANFKKNSPGCRCCASTIVTGKVSACQSTVGISGLTVTLYDSLGGVLGTATTNGSGVYTITSSASGSVTATATTGSTRTTSTTVAFTVTAGVSNTKNITMGVAATWACFVNCSLPISQTLTLTSTGTCTGVAFPADTLTWQSTSPSYLSTLALTGPCWRGATAITVPSGSFAQAQTDYHYYMNATNGNLYIESPDANVLFTPPHPVAAGIVGTGSGSMAPTTCVPFLWSQTCVVGGNRFGGTVHE